MLLNLQNPSLTLQQSNIKEEEETYTISNIINGQISRELLLNIFTRFMNQNLGESDEITCEKRFTMKDHLRVIINELKSARLIIKILQNEIKSSHTGRRDQDNLPGCVECKSYKKRPTTRDSVWEEIKQIKNSTVQPKKMLNCARQQNSYITLSKNRYEPISYYQSQDDLHNCVQTKSNQ